MKTTKAQILTGFSAISLNTIILKVAKPLHIKAEGGGLLKLILLNLPSMIAKQPFLHSELFGYIFHYLTGGIMVAIYFLFFEKLKLAILPRGVIFSLFPWLINSFLVLPLLDQGIFGYMNLPLSGICYFFFANLCFGVSLSMFYAKLHNNF